MGIIRTKNSARASKTNTKVSDEVGDYGNDPYFVKKAEDMKALIKRVGSPKQFVERHGKANGASV